MGGRAVRVAIARTPRPKDRKAQIIAAASDLFYRQGYHRVGTEQIAQAVGITAGALYRHFRSKQDLLAQALIDSFDRATVVVDQADPQHLESMIEGLAHTAGARRDLGVLWNRETRHLDDEHRRMMRRRFFAFLAHFTKALHRARRDLSESDADLLAWSVVAGLTSPSYHATAIGQDELVDLLRDMTLAVCTTPLPELPVMTPPRDPAGAGIAPHSRRETLLAAATALFNRRGYQAVTMGDIGAAAGIRSASVYKHFATKADVLAAVIARAAEPLRLGLNHALAIATTPQQALHNALVAYIEFALVHHDLVGILISEVTNLPEPQRHAVRVAQHDYVAEWVRLMMASHPDLDEVEARFRVHGALTIINDVTRTKHLRARPNLAEELRVVATRVLQNSQAGVRANLNQADLRPVSHRRSAGAGGAR